MRAKSWIVGGAFISFTALMVWVALSLNNDESAWAAELRHVKRTMCWPADSSTACVLKAMAKYEKKGRYEDAANIGTAWAEKYPESPESGWIYQEISVSYLKRAEKDSSSADDYLKQAIFFRDKALPSSSDSQSSLQRLAVISESVGDLSAAQRCVQYRNSIKLLNRLNLLADEDKNRVARQFKPDLNERKSIDCFLEWIDTSIRRVNAKFSASGCQ